MLEVVSEDGVKWWKCEVMVRGHSIAKVKGLRQGRHQVQPCIWECVPHLWALPIIEHEANIIIDQSKHVDHKV